MARGLLWVFIVLVPAGCAESPRELIGGVEILSSDGTPERVALNASVVIRETQGSAVTNSNGFFRIPLPDQVRGGDEIHLGVQVPGYVIYKPEGGYQRIPADLDRDPIEIAMVPMGSELLLSTAEWRHLVSEAERGSTEAADSRIRSAEGTTAATESSVPRETNLMQRHIRDWALRHGFGIEQVEAELFAWVEEVASNSQDEKDLGLAAFAAHQFAQAAQHFSTSATQAEQDLERLVELARVRRLEAIGDRRSEGNAHLAARDHDRAVAAYRRAHSLAPRDELPVQWAGTLTDMGAALRKQANVVTPERAAGLLDQAIESYRLALDALTPEALPAPWARTQTNLGVALRWQADHTSGQPAIQLLREAVAAHRAALDVLSRSASPALWADIQNNLAVALDDQSNSESSEAAELLAEAVAAHRAVLEIRTREGSPIAWAETQNNLGAALFGQARLTPGADATPLLEASVEAFRLALETWPQESHAWEWAATQNNLGAALPRLAQSAQGEARVVLLEAAVRASRLALDVRTRAVSPQAWAETQGNLGLGLAGQAGLAQGAESLALFEQAEAAYRSALKVYSRETSPGLWARTQNNLGGSLWNQARRNGGDASRALFDEAVAAYQGALTVRTQESEPHGWATTQYSLGLARRDQAVRSTGATASTALAQSIEAHGLALRVFTPEVVPRDWALAQLEHSWGLAAQGRFEEAAVGVDTVVSHFDGLTGAWVASLVMEVAGATLEQRSADRGAAMSRLLQLVREQSGPSPMRGFLGGVAHLLAEGAVSNATEELVVLFEAFEADTWEGVRERLETLGAQPTALPGSPKGPRRITRMRTRSRILAL